MAPLCHGGDVKITDCTTFVIGNPPPHFGGRYFIVVKLTTDTGMVGYGEIYVASVGPHTVRSGGSYGVRRSRKR